MVLLVIVNLWSELLLNIEFEMLFLNVICWKYILLCIFFLVDSLWILYDVKLLLKIVRLLVLLLMKWILVVVIFLEICLVVMFFFLFWKILVVEIVSFFIKFFNNMFFLWLFLNVLLVIMRDEIFEKRKNCEVIMN